MAGAIFHPSAAVRKDIENRPGLLSYRGELAIHAGQRLGDGDAFYAVARLTGAPVPVLGSPRTGPEWSLGAIVGVVDLVSAHRSCECNDRCSVWAQSFKAHHRLANPRTLARPVPALGQQTLWTVPPEVEAEIRRQLG
jgi:hypothetical protein